MSIRKRRKKFWVSREVEREKKYGGADKVKGLFANSRGPVSGSFKGRRFMALTKSLHRPVLSL